MKHPRIIFFFIKNSGVAICIVVLALILSGCLSATPTLTPGPIETATPTPLPTATATPIPLGNPENPLVLGLVALNPGDQLDQPAENLAEKLSKGTGVAVKARVFIGYKELLDAMSAGKAHIAWMPPLTYLYASKYGIAEVVLLTNHFGVYLYGTQFLANAGSGFAIYFDPLSGQNSANADTALAQFAGKKPCWVDPDSTSGYILPAGMLALRSVNIQPPAFTQSHAAVVRTLYVKGVCDFGATFAISGDPRTASSVLADLPDALNRIPIIWRSDALIPNVNLALIAGLHDDQRQALIATILDLSKTQEGRTLLSDTAGGYEIEAIKPVEDSIYDPLREVVKALNLSLSDLIGK